MVFQGIQVYPVVREKEDQLERRVIEGVQALEREDIEGLLGHPDHQANREPALQVHPVLRAIAVHPVATVSLVYEVRPVPPATVTLRSVSAFPITVRDTEVHNLSKAPVLLTL